MRKKLLDGIVSMATRRRWPVFAVSLFLTLLLGWASQRLVIDMRWSTLLPETLPVVGEFIKIDNNFLQPGNMIVVISGPDPAVLEQVTDEASALLQDGLVCEKGTPVADCVKTRRFARYVYGGLPEDWLTDHLMRLLKPREAERMADVFADPRLLPYLTHLNDDFEAEYTDADNVKNQERQIVASLDAVHGFIETLSRAADGEPEKNRLTRTVRDLTIGRPYMFSLDNSMSLITVASVVPSDDAENVPLIDKQIEKLLSPLADKYPGYRIERTGMTAVGRDEMDSIGPQTMLISLVALVLLFLLLVWYFRSFVTPVFSLIPIVAGIIWTVGFVALTLGEMNIITVMIMAVLLGLGIDFSIHLSSRFHEEMAAGRSLEESLALALGGTGRGVITGAVTTSVAFFTLMIADTKGIEQFGFCAGTGVLVTLFAVLWILPSLLAARAVRSAKKGRAPERSKDFRALGFLAETMGRHWKIVIPAVIVGTILGVKAGNDLEWEWNFLNLEAEGLRSVLLQDEIIDKFKLSVSFSLLTAESVEESRLLRKKFTDKNLVGEVDDISMWVSRQDFDESIPYIRKLRAALRDEGAPLSFVEVEASSGRSEEADPTELRKKLGLELDRLWANLVEIQALAFTGGQDRVVEKTRSIVATRDTRDQGSLKRVVSRIESGDSVDWEAVDRFAHLFEQLLRSKLMRMAEGDDPVTIEMVPEDIVAKYTSNTAPGFLMSILPKENLYEREDLELFQDVVSKVHPNVTGMPQMMLNMNLETLREGRKAALAAILVILLVLVLDFRRPLIAVLAFLPLVTGLALTLGIMWVMGEKLNYINMIALPVIIGIGVDDGVHFFHRFIQEGRGGMPRAVTSVGRAILMTSLTTMIGFGSLMLYMMRGMASLGFVLFVGVGMCFLSTITLLPPLAVLFEKRIIRDTGDR